jgi:hypothetical protein
LSRRRDATATVKQREVDSCISHGYRGAELKDRVGLACFAVGRPKESRGGALDEWRQSTYFLFICKTNDVQSRSTTKKPKTYNTRDSLVVTDPTTDLALLMFVYVVNGVRI